MKRLIFVIVLIFVCNITIQIFAQNVFVCNNSYNEKAIQWLKDPKSLMKVGVE